jgi:hypothetical protein
VDVNVFATDFARKNFGGIALAPAGAVFQTDVPAMPTADNFTKLDNAFAQRKSKVRAEILDRIDAILPSEKSNLQTSRLNGSAQTFTFQL